MVQAPDIVNMGVHKDLPQALVLLSEMNVSAQHVASLVDDMIQKVRNGELSTDQGLSFLEMKYNMLLSYLINLTYVVLRKCSGGKIDGDPCLDRLVEIRTVLEKIRPIEHKLKYQIDKLVKTAVSGTANADDPTSFKPHPERLIAGEVAVSEDEDDESESDAEGADTGKTASGTKGGKYVPPKLSAVHYDEPNLKKTQERTRKQQLSQAIMQDLREEYLDTPTEVAHASRAQQVLNKQQQERQRYEEEYMTRLPVSKAEKHQQRRQLTTLGTLGDEITDFGSAAKSNRKRKSAGGKKPKRSFKRKRFH